MPLHSVTLRASGCQPRKARAPHHPVGAPNCLNPVPLLRTPRPRTGLAYRAGMASERYATELALTPKVKANGLLKL